LAFTVNVAVAGNLPDPSITPGAINTNVTQATGLNFVQAVKVCLEAQVTIEKSL
jgi:hypothetical protein